ncbi:MAG: hypothetical protein RL418_572 [Actinomycetota bacterium]
MRSQCSHCTGLAIARELGVAGLAELLSQFYVKPDNLAIRYGMRFESELEQELKQNLGEKVQAPKEQTMEATIELMNQGVPIIYQGVLRGGSGAMLFSGRPDFLIKNDWEFVFTEKGLGAVQVGSTPDGYTAWDAKLSSSAKPEYQIQVGLYADVLETLGLIGSSHHGLILGSRQLQGFGADVLIAQMVQQRSKFLAQCFEHIDAQPQRIEDIGSLICDASSYCDICEYPALCDHMRRETNHLQLVAGITRANIESLNRSGVKTVAQLASFTGTTDKLSHEQVQKLSRQAMLQQQTYDTGKVYCQVIDQAALHQLPDLNDGDVFFDLEGFTFFEESGGIEYLWGWTSIDGGERFNHVWADDRAEEKLAFETFMVDALQRQAEFPGCKIYHYANYEQVALRKLAKRHGTFESEVDQLLNNGVLIDLYKTVKQSLVISQESYSIKKLEAFYQFKRVSDVKEALGSMEYYDQYLQSTGVNREKLKRQVIAYNQDDCASTLALYKWLKTL